MAERWYFTKEELEESPSAKCGMNRDTEILLRSEAANLIQDLGERLKLSQFTILNATVYMHRFYMAHPFTTFEWKAVSLSALFLAAKSESARPVDVLIRYSNVPNVTKSDVLRLESLLLVTLGFEVDVIHPHLHVVEWCNEVHPPKEMGQLAYLLATLSLQLTPMCLRYMPKTIASVCIFLSSKWTNWKIPDTRNFQPWFSEVDPEMTQEFIRELTQEYLVLIRRGNSKLKDRVVLIQKKYERMAQLLTLRNTMPYNRRRDARLQQQALYRNVDENGETLRRSRQRLSRVPS